MAEDTKTAGFKSLQAAADFMGPGSIEAPKYQPEVLDIVRRELPIWARISKQPATGHPSRYFEQTTIPQGGFTNPRQITATRVAPTRLERSFAMKAISAEITLSQFDIDIAKQQGSSVSSTLAAKDLLDTISGVTLVAGRAIWAGTDTSLTLPTTTQYVGGETQITLTGTIAIGASIEASIKAQVAAMVGNTTFNPRPTAIYASPQALDLYDQEVTLTKRVVDKLTTASGLVVTAIMTQAGLIPLIPDPGLVSTPNGANTDYPIVIVSEPLVEFHHIGGEIPRVFELGLLANLAQQRVVVLFGAPVFKGPSYAHCVMTLTR
jgi:hypothetical protein